ncbi:permease for cytosine/purines, uracil, thiamine, allantoin-domain-containing protein [Dactylonectria macrodidyma]|uniref:Permease for cytosine/purines, uracil, thiamine, allantoin-domain-containing protein n=1 Tax=Dactylonectria macrodidyma TaxID=307937 RepID=A0A9P9FFB0_9HYPO|nr:permease for cytosine/purines, uracil, thiamine, allantoin-domain-containing protein [Dactylonectria macrodidyma]
MKDQTTQVDNDLEANQPPPITRQALPSEDVQARRDTGDDNSEVSVKHGPVSNSRWYLKLLDAGVEENGIRPVPREERTQTEYSELFTVFFTCLLCVLPLPTGALGTAVYGLKLRDVSLIIILFNIITCIPPAFIGIGGVQTGMRQMVQARYSFGLFFGIVPLLLNAGTVTGFTLIGSIVSGQAIAAVNEGAHISVNVGIGIVCSLSFVTALLGYRAIHVWQRWQWLPNLIGIVIAVGCGGKHLVNQVEAGPATVKSVIGYGSLMAGYFMTFGGTASDFTTYHSPNTSNLKVFTYVYLGLLTPSTPLLILGAAIGGAIPNVDAWQAAWDSYGIGGVLAEMLQPAGGFGKFVLVILALSVVGNMVLSNYSVALCLQMLVPIFARVPRFVFIFLTMAIMVPMAIYAAAEWATSLENFLSVIGYWAGCFDAVVIEELVVFRKMDYTTFDPRIWNKWRRLPPGFAAIGASLVSLVVVIPSMNTTWYTGPIGEHIGDVGFEVAFVVTALAYYPLRSLEIKWSGRI